MKNEAMRTSWAPAFWALAVVVVVVALLMFSGTLTVKSAAQTREAKAKGAPMAVQWQPQSLIEARFQARLAQDVEVLKGHLDRLAGMDECPDWKTWADKFSKHFLKHPKLWVDGEMKETWENVLPALYAIVKGSQDVSINFAGGVLDYVPYDNIKKPKPEDDVDFVFKIKVIFSASPGDNVLEGALMHRRVCEIGS